MGYRRFSAGSRMWLTGWMYLWPDHSVDRAMRFEADSCDGLCAAVCLLTVRLCSLQSLAVEY